MKALTTLAVAATLLSMLTTPKARAADQLQALASKKVSVCKQLASIDKQYPVGGNFSADLSTWCKSTYPANFDSNAEMETVYDLSNEFANLDTANLPIGHAGDVEADSVADAATALADYANSIP